MNPLDHSTHPIRPSSEPATAALAQWRVQQLHITQGDWTLCRQWSHSWMPGLHLLQGGDGAGKTSLLRVLAGAMAPRSGRVWADVNGALPDQVLQVFWVDPRQPELAGSRDPAQWVDALAQRYPAWNAQRWHQHVAGWALEGMLHKPWEALSTGTARKVWMAAALSSGAAWVLIDEPVAGLDKPSVRYLQQALAAHRADALEHTSTDACPQWVMVAHYDDVGVPDWDSVLELESLPR